MFRVVSFSFCTRFFVGDSRLVMCTTTNVLFVLFVFPIPKQLFLEPVKWPVKRMQLKTKTGPGPRTR